MSNKIKLCKIKHFLDCTLPLEMCSRLKAKGFGIIKTERIRELYSLEKRNENNYISITIKDCYMEVFCLNNGHYFYQGKISNIAYFEDVYENVIKDLVQ